MKQSGAYNSKFARLRFSRQSFSNENEELTLQIVQTPKPEIP
jgi:hypothetical protein